MTDLVICHVPEYVSVKELQLFLRLFHRSNLPSKSDLLFIFPATSTSFDAAIREETESFLKLVHKFQETGGGNASGESVASFDVTQLVKSSKKEAERAETIWGRKIRSNLSEEGETELTRPSYGSVVSFDVGELDPEDSLAGFLDHVPLSLRRWACYPMLLGRVRRNFKHVMLVDVKEVLLLGDPLGRARSKSPESVHLSTLPTKHGRKNSDKTHQKPVNPAIIMGGARGIRRLSAAMLPEIVRATTSQHKRKSPVTESALLNELVGNDYVLKNINLAISTELVPEVSSLSGLRPGCRLALLNHTVIRRGNSNIDIDAIIMKHICSFSLDSSVYSDC